MLVRHANRLAAASKPVIDRLEGRLLFATYTVDDSFAAPNNVTQFNTIQAAVDVSADGDTINVKAGVYDEYVTVDKRLKINGAQSGKDARTRKIANGIDQKESTVTGDGHGFLVNADGVTIDGFTFEKITDGPALHTNPTISGFTIKNNNIEDNGFGLYLHSSGTVASKVEKNRFSDNNAEGMETAAAGNGIYADQGTVNVKISDNLFRQHQNVAILFASTTPGDGDALQSRLTIEKNTSENDRSLLLLIDAADVDVKSNTVKDTVAGNNDADLQGSAIYVTDSSNVDVKSNTIDGGSNRMVAGYFAGVAVRDSYGPSSDILIEGNTIKNTEFGVDVTDQTEAATVVKKNTISKVLQVGIHLGAGTSLNRIEENKIEKSGILDAQDESGGQIVMMLTADVTASGAGTNGTDNIWKKNKGKTSDPAGLVS